MSIRRARSLAAAVCVAVLFAAPIAAQTDPELERWRRNGVFVIGSLHGLHETEQSFSFVALQRILAKAAPQVIVLEVRPDELEHLRLQRIVAARDAVESHRRVRKPASSRSRPASTAADTVRSKISSSE